MSATSEDFRNTAAWEIIEDCADRDGEDYMVHCVRTGKVNYSRARSTEASRRLVSAGYTMRAYQCEHVNVQGKHFHLATVRHGKKLPKRKPKEEVEAPPKALVYRIEQWQWVYDCPLHPESKDHVQTSEPMASQHRAYARLLRHLRRAHDIVI